MDDKYPNQIKSGQNRIDFNCSDQIKKFYEVMIPFKSIKNLGVTQDFGNCRWSASISSMNRL